MAFQSYNTEKARVFLLLSCHFRCFLRDILTPKQYKRPRIYGCIYIYIYTLFQKGFHIERDLDRYLLLFSCTCARVHFSFGIVQLVKKLGSTIHFFFVGFFVPIWKEHVVWVFFRKKASALHYKFAMANYMTDFGNKENSPRSSRVMRRHQIDRPEMSWHLKQEAKHFCWRGVFKNTLSRGVLKRNC